MRPPTEAECKGAYTALASLLSPPEPSILEIEILPPSLTPPGTLYLSDPPSLGIPKSTLIAAYLHARALPFPPTTTNGSPDPSPPNPNPNPSPDLLPATAIILLYDPEHLTACNTRKRHLLSLPPSDLPRALTAEIALLTTLLTSPLNRHTKSPTLWSHRFFLLRTFPQHLVTDASSFWTSEFRIILRAAELHKANYYAFSHARRVLRFFDQWEEDGPNGEFMVGEEVWQDTARSMAEWCLRHPGDVSGWAFLGFVFCGGEGVGADGVRTEVFDRVVGWRGKVGWEGEAMRGFLEGVGVIGRGVWV
ncbi:hypothetical protein EJ06DRAFT_583176 [Trichodelitschia bisporula]|uniref:Uncharacterized protein n=1 Tax=Trichodelitschia bisporula TaxID=703511 RepID=A0A6G1HT55_9PEZI|nr:hypothetical protein EJ06DRAFT_583176 [Trichodelitschia bisporula]